MGFTQQLKFLLFVFVLNATTPLWAAPQCIGLFDRSTKTEFKISNDRTTEVEKVVVSKAEFNKIVKSLRATLSGKLATVWRSEWKAKLSIAESNQYVLDLINESLTPATRHVVLHGLDVNYAGFTRQVHARLSELKLNNKLAEGDNLITRDLPTPTGAIDRAFTYYTKPLSQEASAGKHQIRIRSYIREINWETIPTAKSVDGFNHNGDKIVITRLAARSYSVTTSNKTTTPTIETLTKTQMLARFAGPTISLYAPHGKSFKLEVKTALEDAISDAIFKNLAGQHMVQKLDISLTPAQVEKLFAPMKDISESQKIQESIDRIESIYHEIIASSPENQARAVAVFDVLKLGVQKNANFLMIEGATVYNRTAFESKDGFQTTVDRDQRVYAGMYTKAGLKTPFETMDKRNKPIMSSAETDARHVEFKLPVTLMKDIAGIEFSDPNAAPASQLNPATKPEDQAKVLQIRNMVLFYHKYVKTDAHPGKFNYLRKNGEIQSLEE